MSTPQPLAPAAPPTPVFASHPGPTKEVRFAVVMYGGVSLCIYMNGIAQELLHMVRATAADPPAGPRPLSGVEQVYRTLGRLLREGRAPGENVRQEDPVSTRFSVDILSGTSAGGINSIFLAKALARDEDMLQLKKLWMTEGDIGKLINDGASTRDTGLPRPRSPQSLLNGQRMYRKLVEAFDGMDEAVKDRPANAWRPLVPELDLFVTTTDIAGVPLPLQLSDDVVHERRHRGVFHFHLKGTAPEGARPAATRDGASDEPDHFTRRFNPFLAFAARCTSAFPFAFEPMRLRDIDPVLDTLDAHRGRTEGRSGDARWTPFLERFVTPEGTARVDPAERPFGDGGYLDNKPFSYASESLLRREGGIPVDRKLIYIEPRPEHPERDAARTHFDAIENVMAATVGLPRYETIREDLERVMARNRLTERVRMITQALERDLENARHRTGIIPKDEWGARYLAEMVRAYGFAYGSYHRLRVAATTDWLAKVVTRAAGLGDGSRQALGIRRLVSTWRDGLYALERPGEGEPARESQNRFLLRYDLDFRLRRLGYLLSKINTLHTLDEDEQRILAQINHGQALSPDEEVEFRAEMVAVKRKLHPLYQRMRVLQEDLGARGSRNPCREHVRSLAITADEIDALLERSGTAQDVTARELLTAGGRREALQRTAEFLAAEIDATRKPLSDAVETLKEANHPSTLSAGGRIARRVLWHYYDYYSDYDLVSYPILYSTDAGEVDTVDIIRISPEDARHVMDERTDGRGRRKLAGTALFSFGAFLQESWRANDILWGRLDGAERIICSLLPHPDDRSIRDRLLEDAALAIVREELMSANSAEVSRLMAESLVAVAAGRPPDSAVARLAGRIGNEVLPTRLEAVFGECLDEGKLLQYLRDGYEVNRELDPQAALGALARGSRVVGHMLEGITERHSREGRRVRWLTRAASWFWGLVQVAIPRSLPALLFDHWLGLFYTLAVLLVGVGVFAGGEVMGWGVRILGAALAVHAVVLVFRDYMRHRGKAVAVLTGLGVVVLLGLLAAGAAWVGEQALSAEWLRRARGWAGLGAWTGIHTAKALCGALGAAILFAGLWPVLRRPWKGLLPGGFAGPMLASEFPADAAALARLTRGVLLPPEPARPADRPETPADAAARTARDADRERHRRIPGMILRGVYADYGFIAAYWLLFLLLADRLVALARPPLDGRMEWALLGLGVGAGVAGTAAALCDVVENGRIHEAFTAFRGREEDWMARGIRLAAAWKWALVFITVLLLSALFFASDSPAQWALGGWWVAVAALGLWGAIGRPRLLEWVFPALGLGLLAAAHLLGRG